ncbi:alpha/beta hydrolase [bacterium]|nr:alpha/beta hydrolase [bacterium]
MNFEKSFEEESEYESGAMETKALGEDLETNTNEGEEGKENNIYTETRKIAEDLLVKYKFFNEADVVEISPEEIAENVPVFASPGWGVSPEAWSDSLKIIAEEGERKVVTANFTREEIINEEEGADIPASELQKALAIIDILNSKGLEEVDGIGHSEGGLNLAIAASLFPEKFRNLVFVSPAGSIDISREELVKRFAIDEGIEEMKGMDKGKILSFKTYLKAIVGSFLKNPILSHKEVDAMTKLDIFEMTKWLKEKGVDVGFVAGANDQVFKMDEINKKVGVNNIDNYLTTKGNHGSLIFDSQHATLAGNLLHNMKMKKVWKNDNKS